MRVAREYVNNWCPNCLSFEVHDATSGAHCAKCLYAFPLHFIIPYTTEAWTYTDELRTELHKYEALKLMAPFGGGNPEAIGEYRRVRELYLSRYRGFDFSYLAEMPALRSFELDFTASVRNVDGIADATALSVLQLTECRKLEDVSGLDAMPSVRLLHIALCSQLRDLSPLARLPNLEKLYVEGNILKSLAFLPSCRSVTDLALSINRIEDADPSPLLTLLGLRRITIATRAIPRGFGQVLRRALPNCEVNVFTKT